MASLDDGLWMVRVNKFGDSSDENEECRKCAPFCVIAFHEAATLRLRISTSATSLGSRKVGFRGSPVFRLMLSATPKKSSQIRKHSRLGATKDLPFVRTNRNAAPLVVACPTIRLMASGFIVSCLPDRLQFRGRVARVASEERKKWGPSRVPKNY